MELAHRMTTPEPPANATATRANAMDDAGDDPRPTEFDWTDLEPTAAWTSYEVRSDVARLAPGMPLPFLSPEQQELWRVEWEQSDRGQGEASFEEWLGEQMHPDEVAMRDDYEDDYTDAAWVEPRGFG